MPTTLLIVGEIREKSYNVINSPSFPKYLKVGAGDFDATPDCTQIIFVSFFPSLPLSIPSLSFFFLVDASFASYGSGLYLIPYLEVTGNIPLVFTIILWLLLTLLGVGEGGEKIISSSFCHFYDNEAATILYHFSSSDPHQLVQHCPQPTWHRFQEPQ